MKHVAYAEAEIQKSPLDRARGPLKIFPHVSLQYSSMYSVAEYAKLEGSGWQQV